MRKGFSLLEDIDAEPCIKASSAPAAQKYQEQHDWYYINRNKASAEEIEKNFLERQKLLFEHLQECLKSGVAVSRLALQAVAEELQDVIKGHCSKLLSPINAPVGRPSYHHTVDVMIGMAVSYMALCEKNKFKRKDHIKFIQKCYDVHRNTARSWMKKAVYEKWQKKPYPFTSQDAAESNLVVTGEIYRNAGLAHSNAANKKKIKKNNKK